MVQRKSPEKLGIKADSKNHVKSEKQSTTVQNSSAPQNPDVRNKGGSGHELKKMMKKSRSIKRSEFDILRSNSIKRGAKSRPDKATPPVNEVSAAAVTPRRSSLSMVTPQKPPQVKIPEGSPNYMKSTTSSIARKERSQVSPHNSKTSSDNKSPGRKDSNSPEVFSASGHKPAKTLMKKTSLRPVRTLTKTSSNKAGRTSMKKSSGVAIYKDQKVRKATCSSTLKDSKFPAYVPLHPGGTESEGTSVMKVCPYTYCSLNGHHHAQLPPLKHFMSARRRLLKTQKSMKLKSLSSINKKPSGKPKKDIDTGQMLFNKDPAISEEDSAGSVFSPCIEEESSDFFVEIYTQARKVTSKSEIDDGDEAKKGFSGDPWVLEDPSFSAKDGSETGMENNEQYAESLPDDSSHSAISFEDYIDHDKDFSMEVINTPTLFLEYEQNEKVEDGNCAVSDLGDFCNGNESGEYETDGSIFDASGMEWEEGEVVDIHLDDEATHDQIFCLQGFTNTEQDNEDATNVNDNVGNYKEDVPSSDELQVIHGEEFDGADQALEIEPFSGINSEQSNTYSSVSLEDPLPSTEINDVKDAEPAEYPLEEPTHILLEYEKSTCSENVEHDSELDEEEKSSGHEIHHSTASEDPDAGAEVVQCLQEPEENECQLNSQIPEPVDLETKDVASLEDQQSDVLPVPDANIDDSPEEVKDSEDQLGGKRQKIYGSIISDEDNDTAGRGLKPVEDCSTLDVKMEIEDDTADKKAVVIKAGCSPDQEHLESYRKFKPIRCQRHIEVTEEPREFNPRGPRFLPLEPEEDPETVDLRHQMMDERKNSEEWMVDYALRQAVRKLAPAQKRKVALLVKAFETVTPMRKYEIHLPLTPTGFAHARSMLACN